MPQLFYPISYLLLLIMVYEKVQQRYTGVISCTEHTSCRVCGNTVALSFCSAKQIESAPEIYIFDSLFSQDAPGSCWRGVTCRSIRITDLNEPWHLIVTYPCPVSTLNISTGVSVCRNNTEFNSEGPLIDSHWLHFFFFIIHIHIHSYTFLLQHYYSVILLKARPFYLLHTADLRKHNAASCPMGVNFCNVFIQSVFGIALRCILLMLVTKTS